MSNHQSLLLLLHMLLIHDKIGVFWDFHEVTSYHFHIWQWLINEIWFHRNLQWKRLLDSWMKQSKKNNALTDASFFVFKKTNPSFWVNHLCQAKTDSRTIMRKFNFGRLVLSMMSNSLSVKLSIKTIPKNTLLSFNRQKKTRLLKKMNTGGGYHDMTQTAGESFCHDDDFFMW